MSEEAAVTAYQIGFDLYENATQQFLHRVTDALSHSDKIGHLMERPRPVGDEGDAKKPDEVATGEPGPAEPAPEEEAKTELSSQDKTTKKRLELLNSILSGDKASQYMSCFFNLYPSNLYFFLYKGN